MTDLPLGALAHAEDWDCTYQIATCARRIGFYLVAIHGS